MDNNNKKEKIESLSEEEETDPEQSIEISQASSEIDDDTERIARDLANKIIYPRFSYFSFENDTRYLFNNCADVGIEYCNDNGLVLRFSDSSDASSESFEAIEQIEDTTTTQPDSDTCSSLKKFLPKELSEEQTDFVEFVRNKVKSMSSLSEVAIQYIFLTGYAGTGKTSTLAYIRDIENSNILYITNTKSLCAMIRANYQLETMNFFNFFRKALGLTTDETLDLMRQMQEEFYNGVSPVINSEFFSETFSGNDLVHIIFLDEFSMFSPHALSRFMDILKSASTELRYKFLVILCGDFMHIPPVITRSLNYQPIITRFCKIYNFQEQLRITDADYLKTIMQLTRDHPVDSSTFLNELTQIPNSHNFNSPIIQYTYPFKLIAEAYSRLRSSSSMYSWLNKLGEDFFSNVLTLRAFAFVNSEVCDLNFNLAFNIIHQLTELEQNFELIRSFVCFAKFSSHHLPLIRFFPYYVLSSGNSYSGSIVYLIDWNLDAGFVTVYYPYDNKFLNMRFDYFYMKIYPQQQLYGIPLELAFASTFHKAQGQTFDEYIVVSLNNIDHRDLFSILSRIRTVKQIRNLYRN